MRRGKNQTILVKTSDRGINFAKPLTMKKKILVADDSAIYRKLVEHTLSDDNHNVVFAKNGREALELYGKQHVRKLERFL